MSYKRTVLQTYAGEDFTFQIEKWWIVMPPDQEIESYAGLALVYITKDGQKAALLSGIKTKELLTSIQKEMNIH